MAFHSCLGDRIQTSSDLTKEDFKMEGQGIRKATHVPESCTHTYTEP